MIRRKIPPFSLWHYAAIIPLCLCFQPVAAQDILWEKSYGGKQADILFDVVPTPDYGFILAGSSASRKSGNKTEANRGDLDYWVWKMNEKGELDWQKTFGSTGQDKLRSVILTNDGGFLLAGSSDSKLLLPKNGNESDFHDGDKKSVIRLHEFASQTPIARI